MGSLPETYIDPLSAFWGGGGGGGETTVDRTDWH